jgi:hypothetical protein
MKNTIGDLNNYLFEQLERLNDDETSEEDLEKELKKTDAIIRVSQQIIANGNLALQTMKHMDEYGYNARHSVPAMLMDKAES